MEIPFASEMASLSRIVVITPCHQRWDYRRSPSHLPVKVGVEGNFSPSEGAPPRCTLDSLLDVASL